MIIHHGIMGESREGVEQDSARSGSELIESMPRGAAAVVKAKGGYTKY